MSKARNTIIAGTLGLALLASGLSFAKGHDALNPADYSLDLNQASAIALQQVPGAIREAELEREDGTVVWEFEIVGTDKQSYELTIDATDGKLISKELDEDQCKGKSGHWFGSDDSDKQAN